MNQSQSEKWMTHGEAGLAVFFAASAFLCMIAAGKALDTAFAFHASLGSAASLAAVFAIFNRYFDRPVALPPQEMRRGFAFEPIVPKQGSEFVVVPLHHSQNLSTGEKRFLQANAGAR
jgi:hypothetical protein